MNVPRVCTILLLAGSMAFAGSNTAVDSANAKSLSPVGKPAPGFSLPDLDQKAFNLADRRGKVVVLVFWATWCSPCVSELPAVGKLQKELAPEGVDVAAVAFDDPVKARNSLAKKKIDVWSLVDATGNVASLYVARALPKTFLINRGGTVVSVLIGKLSESGLRDGIQAARR